MSVFSITTRTWDGGGADNNLATAANWVGDVAPVAGDALVFTGSGNGRTTIVNNYAVATSFTSITLSGANGSSASYSLSGNSIVLSGGATAISNNLGTSNSGGYTLSISNDITFSTAAPTISITVTTSSHIDLSGNINNGGYTITLNNIGNTTNLSLSGTISGTGGLIFNGAAIVAISGANTYSGGTTINSGTVRISTASAFGNISGTVVINGGSLNTNTAGLTLNDYPMTWNASFGYWGNQDLNLGNGAVSMSTNISIDVAVSRTLTVGGIISGNFSLTKTSTGTLTLSGSNTYGQTTTISAGTIKLGSASALGSASVGTIVSADAVLDINGQNYTNTEPLTINTTATGSVINSSSTAATFAGLVTLGSSSFLNASVGDINFSNTGAMTGDYNLILGGSANGILRHTININTATVTKLDAGTWTLTRSNPYTGATTISDGTLVLQANDSRSTSYSIASGTVLELNRSDNQNYARSTTFSGSGTLRKTGAGNITWTAASTYALTSGALIDIQAGQYICTTGETWTNNYADITVASGATFSTGSQSTVRVDELSGAGSVVVGQTSNVGNVTLGVDNGSSTFSGVISDYGASNTGVVTKLGTGTLILTGTNTYSGGTTISGGIVQVGAGSTSGSIIGDVVDNATLIFNRSDSYTFSGIVSGTGNLTKQGTNQLILGSNNSYTGVTTISTGKIYAPVLANGGSNSSIGASSNASSNLILDGGTLRLNLATADASTDRLFTVTANGGSIYSSTVGYKLTFTNTGSIVMSGTGTRNLDFGGTPVVENIFAPAIPDPSSGSTTVTKNSGCTWVLSGSNTFTGTTTIAGGILKLGSSSALGNVSGATSITSGAVLDVNGQTYSLAEPLTINGTGISSAGALINSSSTTATYAGLLTLGSVSSIIGGTGLISLTNSGTITGATLGLTLGGSQGGNIASIIGITTGTLTKQDAGTWTLTGANTYSGATTISAGTLQIGNNATSGILPSDVTNNGILTFNRTDNYTYSGVISGTGAVNIIGTETTGSSNCITLSGNNTYTGLTTVASGSTLQLGSTTALGNVSAGTVVLGTLELNGITYSNAEPLIISGTGYNNSSGALLNRNSTPATFAGLLTLSGDTKIAANNNITLSNTGTITGNGYTLTISGTGGSGVLASIIGTGVGGLIKNGSGTWTLNGASTYTGSTTINSGILQLGNASALGDVAGGTTVSSGAVLDLNGINYSNNETLIINGTGISDNGVLINSSATTTANFSGAITLGSASIINTTSNIILGANGIAGGYDLTKIGSASLHVGSGTISLGSLIISAGNFTASSGTMTIAGNFTNNGTFTHNSGTVNFNGTTQSIGAATFNNIIITGGATKTLSGAVMVNSLLTLTSGIVSTSLSNILTIANGASSANIGSDASHIEGPMRKIGDTEFTFPIGASNIVAQLGFIPVSGFSATTQIDAQYFYSSSPNSNNLASGIHNVSKIEYWDISNPTNDASCNVTEYFNSLSRSGIVGSGVDIVKVHYDAVDSKWNNKGGAFINNGNGTGYITSTVAISSFSNDGIASIDGSSSLPIELKLFNAVKNRNNVLLEWETATETNNDYFVLERSLDGEKWITIYSCNGAGTSTIEHSYSFIDFNPIKGLNYYRLKQIDINGLYSYSFVQSINIKRDSSSFYVYPNPSSVEEMNLLIQNFKSNKAYFSIIDATGREISSGIIELPCNSIFLKLSDLCSLSPGLYMISIADDSVRIIKNIQVK